MIPGFASARSGPGVGVGGLVGDNAASAANAYATGVVSGASGEGGFVGVNEPGGSVATSYATERPGSGAGLTGIGGSTGLDPDSASVAATKLAPSQGLPRRAGEGCMDDKSAGLLFARGRLPTPSGLRRRSAADGAPIERLRLWQATAGAARQRQGGADPLHDKGPAARVS